MNLKGRLYSGKMKMISLLRALYVWLPFSFRFKLRLIESVYTVVGPLFRGVPHYEMWRRGRETLRPYLDTDSTNLPSIDEMLSTLEFQYYDKPQVSIIIPAYGEFNTVVACLYSIQVYLPKHKIEVIVTEDSSGDKKMGRLGNVKGLHYISRDYNIGFVGNCNGAGHVARGKYLCFLNADTRVTPGWLDELANTFDVRADCGAVGAKLVYPNGRLQEAGAIIWNDGGGYNIGRNDDPSKSKYNYLHEVDYCSGAALLVRADLFNRLGGFDSRYAPAYYEDADFAFQLRQIGMRVYYQPQSTVIHYEGGSHGTDPTRGIKALQRRNQEIFKSKWREVLVSQRSYGNDVVGAKERLTDCNIIFIIDHYIPQPDRDAGSRTVLCVIRAFLSMGWKVKFWPHNLWYDPEYTAKLQRLGVQVYYGAEYAGRFNQILSELRPWVYAVFINRPSHALHYIRVIRELSEALVLFYGHDIHYTRLQLQRAIGQNHVTARDVEVMHKHESEIWKSVDVIYYPSADEVAIVKKEHVCAHVLELPILAFDKPLLGSRRIISRPMDLLFVGGFAHPPNVDGIMWFVREVLSLVVNAWSDVHLVVVGSNPPKEVLALQSDRVTIRRDISDGELNDLYEAVGIAIAPLRFGAGVKGKVVEAMYRGVPVVTTPIGIQGLPGVGDCLLVAEKPSDFASAIAQLLESGKLRMGLAEKGQKYVQQRFSPQSLNISLQNGLGVHM